MERQGEVAGGGDQTQVNKTFQNSMSTVLETNAINVQFVTKEDYLYWCNFKKYNCDISESSLQHYELHTVKNQGTEL